MSVTIVYRHTNKIDRKSYVGRTSQRPEKRWGSGGKHYVDSPKFWNAIQKYGWEGFDHQLLAFCENEEMGIKVETLFKVIYDTIENGYNCVLNEERSPMLGQKHSEGARAKMKGNKNGQGNKGKKHTEEHKKRNSERKLNLFVDPQNHPRTGTTHTDETKKKMSESHWDCSGENNPMFGTISPMRGKIGANKGKTWKLVDGKRVYSDKPFDE